MNLKEYLAKYKKYTFFTGNDFKTECSDGYEICEYFKGNGLKASASTKNLLWDLQISFKRSKFIRVPIRCW